MMTYTTKDIARFFKNVQITKSCWLWIGKTKKGKYGQIRIHGKNVLAHRFTYEIFMGPIKAGYFILHKEKCGNPNCVNPGHLYMGTQADNIRDRDSWGNAAIGEKNAFAKLSNKEVLKIKQLREKHNYTHETLANMFGVSDSAIWSIINGRTWKHLT